MAHVIFTTVFILLCLLAMVVTAYSHAMFSFQLESEDNVIIGASFNAQFYVERTSLTLIEPEEGEEILQPEFIQVDDHTYEVTFDTIGTYYVTVSAEGTARNGFCVFEVTCDDPIYDGIYCTPAMSWYGTNFSEIQFYFDVSVPATVTATSYLGNLTDYEEFGDVDLMMIWDGDAIPIGEPIVYFEEEDDIGLTDENLSVGESSNDAFVSDEISSDDSTLSSDSSSSEMSGAGSFGVGSTSSGGSSGGGSGASSPDSGSSSDSGASSSGGSSDGDGGSSSSGGSSDGGSSSSSSGGSSGGGGGSASAGE